MRLVIIGAQGMLGRELGSQLERFNPYLLDINECDITNASDVQRIFNQLQPHVVINTAAFTDVEAAQDSAKQTNWRVNAEGVENLARSSSKQGSLLIHFSTDYVFEGSQSQPYCEDALPNPINEYGKAKAEGEERLLGILAPRGSNNPKHPFYLIRTAWLFGHTGPNFIEKMLALAQEKDSVSVVKDQFGTPTYTRDLALRTDELICQHYPFGIYHVTNTGVVSWYELARYVISRWHQLHLEVKNNPPYLMPEIKPVTSDAFLAKAPRPLFSALGSDKTPPLRSWQEAVEEYLRVKLGKI